MDENGNQIMTFLLNNTPRTVTKNNDGTLTVNGQIYTYLGNITLEQLIERNNQTQQVLNNLNSNHHKTLILVNKYKILNQTNLYTIRYEVVKVGDS